MKLNKPLFPRWALSVLLLFTSALPQSEAGIRGVLNGGGYAEMLALTNLQQLPNVLRPFLVAPLSEQISAGEKEIVELILRLDRESVIQKIKLEFFTQSNSTDRIRHSESDPFLIGLAHEALYQPSGEPLAYAEISAIIFEALISWPYLRPRLAELNLGFLDILRLTERLGQYASPSIESLSIYPGEVKSHLIHLKTSSQKTSPLLLIELHDQTLNLNLKIEQHMDCHGFELIQVTGLFFESPYLSGKLRWTCENKVMEGRLAVGFERDTSGNKPKTSLVSLNISGVRQIEGNLRDLGLCELELKK